MKCDGFASTQHRRFRLASPFPSTFNQHKAVTAAVGGRSEYNIFNTVYTDSAASLNNASNIM